MVAGQRYVRCGDCRTATGKAVSEHQFSGAAERDIALTGVQVAEVHPDTRFGGSQADTVRVHPAEGPGIDGNRRRGTFAFYRGDAAVRSDAVRPGGET